MVLDSLLDNGFVLLAGGRCVRIIEECIQIAQTLFVNFIHYLEYLHSKSVLRSSIVRTNRLNVLGMLPNCRGKVIRSVVIP